MVYQLPIVHLILSKRSFLMVYKSRTNSTRSSSLLAPVSSFFDMPPTQNIAVFRKLRRYWVASLFDDLWDYGL
jgi:hypothetical protein